MPRDPTLPAAGHSSSPHANRQRLQDLRAYVRRAERTGSATASSGTAPFGIADIDSHLPAGGLARGALHEVMFQSPGDAGAATAFCTALIVRLAQVNRQQDENGTEKRPQDKTVLWCLQDRTTDAGLVYPPGLAWLQLDASRLLAVRTRRDTDTLWVMEEALRCTGLTAVIGEAKTVDLTASRRLQLAAEASGVTALLLRPASDAPGTSAATTRWRIGAAPSRPHGWAAALGEPGTACWQATLFRCRGGAPGGWVMEWRDETGDLALAAPVRNRPDKPRDAGLAG